MLHAIEFFATLCGSLFSGAALYVTMVEHPARMGLETQIAVRQWALSYPRATRMQAPLALLSCLAGVVAWLIGAGIGWLVAAVLIGAVVPFTFVAIIPTNNRLLAPDLDLGPAETRTLLERWGTLHAVRTTLGLVVTTMDLSLLIWS